MHAAARRFLATALLAALSLPAAAQTVLDLASGYPPGSFHVQNLQAFADDVRQRTNGELQVKVHPAAAW